MSTSVLESRPKRGPGTRLSREEEVALFLEMNRLKRRARELRGELNREANDLRRSNAIEAMEDAATVIRNQLVETYLGLAVCVARPLVGPLATMDELLSEASFTLLRTVEMFDAGRGYRFSTYATSSIRHNLVRMITRRSRELSRRLSSVRPGQLEDDSTDETFQHERDLRRLRFVEKQIGGLGLRQRRILRDRFGLNAEGESRTLRQVARDLGLSHERVRQLELRALQQIRDNAANCGIV